MPLLCEVYAVVGQGNVPRSGIGKADAHSLRQGLTELGEGMGVINELLIRHPCPQGYRRRCDQEDLLSIQGDAGEESLHPFSGLLWAPALEQIIGSVSSGKVGEEEGISRPFCPILEIVHPVCAAKISTHRLSAS